MTSRQHPHPPNLALRRARHALHLSQAGFAKAVQATGQAIGSPNGCSKRLVQKWENGEHAGCRPHYLTALQILTGLPARELGFPIPEDYTPPSGTAIDLAANIDSGPDAAAPETADYCTDEMIAGALERLYEALNCPPAVIEHMADLVEVTTASLYELEHHTPARLFARTVDRHFSVVTALLTAARTAKARHSLTASSGRTVLLMGWLAFDRGDSVSPHESWAAAIATAQATADDRLFAATLIHQSYAAARRGDPAAARELAHTAAARTGIDLRTAAWALTRVALHAAQLGDHQDAATAMRLALEIGHDLPDLKPADGTEPWARAFDRARLLSATAHTAALIEDPNAIDYATRAVNALTPARVKSRAVVLSEAALAAAVNGKYELCLDYASPAVTLARDLGTSLATETLLTIVPRLIPHAENRAARELLPQLAALTQPTNPQDDYQYE